MEPGPQTAEWLERYGPWAIVVVCFAVIAVLFRMLSAERKEHTAQLERIGKEHKAEMTALLERFISDKDKQVTAHLALTERVSNVVDALSRRAGRKIED